MTKFQPPTRFRHLFGPKFYFPNRLSYPGVAGGYLGAEVRGGYLGGDVGGGYLGGGVVGGGYLDVVVGCGG